MHTKALSSLLLLPALGLAAPTRQHPIGASHGGPYSPDYKNKYDRKTDSVGNDLYPEPYVSITWHHNILPLPLEQWRDLAGKQVV
jgi:hypothetical protein